MKIAILVNAFPSVSQTFVLDPIVQLLQLGQDVTIIANGPGKAAPAEPHAEVQRHGLLARTRYRPAVPEAGRLAQLRWYAGQGGRLAPHVAALPALFRQQRLVGGSLLWKLTGVDHFISLADEFDIVHCHFAHNAIELMPSWRTGRRARLVTTFHGSDVNRLARQFSRRAFAALMQQGDAFLANTRFTAEQAIALGCPADRLQVQPMGLQVQRFAYQARSRADGEATRLLSVARLVPKKGLGLMLEAVAAAVAQGEDIALDIVGDGPLGSQLREQVEQLGLQQRVRLHGWLTDVQLQAQYRQAHVFVLPSLTAPDGDREGQALVLQEAQAMGLPVLSTWHNGIPDGVLDGRSGLLVAEGDVSALTAGLLALCRRSQDWAAMGLAGHEFVVQRYDVAVLTRQLLALYRELAA